MGVSFITSFCLLNLSRPRAKAQAPFQAHSRTGIRILKNSSFDFEWPKDEFIFRISLPYYIDHSPDKLSGFSGSFFFCLAYHKNSIPTRLNASLVPFFECFPHFSPLLFSLRIRFRTLFLPFVITGNSNQHETSD